VRALIEDGRVDTVHDLSDGGLLVALAEMALAADIGFKIDVPAERRNASFYFGEDQARYLLVLPSAEADRLVVDAKKAGIPVVLLGRTIGGNLLRIAGESEIALSKLREAHEVWLPSTMTGEL